MTTPHRGMECLEFAGGDEHPPDNVNVSESDGPADEPVSENLDRYNKLLFLSQRQCR